MTKPILDERLWRLIEPLLPKLKPPGPRGGRPRLSNRAALTGILFVLKTGIPWEYLPQEMQCGSGMTCWRRLRDWKRQGVWKKLHGMLLEQLQAAGKIDWSRAVVDSSSVRAMQRGKKTGPSPVDRRKYGSKHHLLVDGQGRVPLAFSVTAANRHDVTELIPLVDQVPAVRGGRGRPRRRPHRLLADRGYDSNPHRQKLQDRHILPQIARRRTPHGSGLGGYRYVVERALSWVHQHRRLKMRFERRDDIHEAFVALACTLICFNCLVNRFC